MSESLNRKACDRCHSQKLSCKRIGDGICERCLRLNAECKSSPSLRFKKQIQHYEQQQQNEQQVQQHSQLQQHSHSQQHSQSQQNSTSQGLQHQQSREMQQQQQLQLQLTPRLDYSQGQSATPQSTLDMGMRQRIEAQDSTERRSPKRRRTGSEVHLVQRDAATDATMKPDMESHLMSAPDGALGLAEYTMSLRNMDYMALSQPSLQSNHLLGPQIPPAVDNYFTLHQVLPNTWASQSHEEVQQLQHHQHLGHHHQQQVYNQVSELPVVVPDLSTTPQSSFSSVQQQQPQQQQQQQELYQLRATPIFCNRRRQGASHTISSCQTERRSRSNNVRINYTDLVIQERENLSGPLIMDQFFPIYARVRVLSTHLESLEAGKEYNDGPNQKPNEFTVAELYKYTHQVVDTLERVARPPNGASVAPPNSPLDAADPANSMFVLSLYARLLDILQRLFTLVRSLLAKADPKKDDTFPAWLLPEMNIGAASIGAHPAFHMSLTVQLALQFLSRLREATVVLGLTNAATSNGNGAATNGSAASERRASVSSDTVSISFSAIKNKEGNLSKTLGQLHDELNEFMDAMDVIDAMEEPDKE